MLIQRLSTLFILLLSQLVAAAPSRQNPSHATRHQIHPQPSTVCFDAVLTWETTYAVGTAKKTALINGQSPGPTLRMNQGDWVEFTVVNNMPFDVTIHFHGITQLNTPWSDGVPGVSQDVIKPGQSYLYKWQADEYGTYFYHAHYHGLIADGLYGPIHINPSANEPNPFSLISNNSIDLAQMKAAAYDPIPVMVSDWSAYTFEQVMAIEEASGYDDFCPDAIIINGKVREGRYFLAPYDTDKYNRVPSIVRVKHTSILSSQPL